MPPSSAKPKSFDEILADAYRRAELRVRESVQRGDLVPLEVIAQRMGSTHESITEAVWAGRLFSVPVGQRVFFPAFFADRGLRREDLEFVIPGLASREPWSKLAFFTTPKEMLGGRTPVDALKRGERDLVKRLALAFNDGKRQSCQVAAPFSGPPEIAGPGSPACMQPAE
jgi:hypothetical protein